MEKTGEERGEKEMKRKEEGENEVRGRNKNPPEILASSLDGHGEHSTILCEKLSLTPGDSQPSRYWPMMDSTI